MHGQDIRVPTDSLLVKKIQSYGCRGEMWKEKQSEIIAAQDQALANKYHYTKILQTEADNKCGLCKQFDETTEHIISTCPAVAKERYIERDDRLCDELHFNICKEMGVKWDNEQWYDRLPKLVETSREGTVTLLWDHPKQYTDHTL